MSGYTRQVKPSGRVVWVPDRDLRLAQREFHFEVLRHFQFPGCVHGYHRRRDRFSACWPHVGCKYLLHLDIRHFFPSCLANHLRLFLPRWGLDQERVEQAVELCCLDGRLPIGAPTSPVLSNVCLTRVDQWMGRLGTYTRYSDQLILSGQSPPDQGLARQILRINGFQVNERKSFLAARGRGKIHALGIQIGETALRLTPEGRRRQRAEQHQDRVRKG